MPLHRQAALQQLSKRSCRKERPPIFFVFRVMGDEVYDFDRDCLADRPDWHLLEYNGPNSTLTYDNRNWVKATWGPLLQPQAGKNMDEFPFASTAQGGEGGACAGTHGWMSLQNFVQGGLLRGFYASILEYRSQPFLVVTVPV